VSELEDLVVDLIKNGYVQEADALVEAAGGMSEEAQDKQHRFFSKAVSDSGEYVNDKHVSIDPKKRVISFRADGISVIKFPRFLTRLLHSLNSVGNTTYYLGKVRRSGHTTVEIHIGS